MSNTNNWVKFHFESNQAWGLCETKEQWEEVKKNYLVYWGDKGGLDLTKAMNSSYQGKYYIDGQALTPDFGFRSEHSNGTYSLAQFATDNNMQL